MTAHQDRANDRDALATLTALRPRADRAWGSEEQDTIRRTIMATGPASGPATAPDAVVGGDGADQPGPLRSSRPGRRRAAVIALGAAVLVGGSGAAAAGGLMPQAFVDAFPWGGWPEGPPVDPADAERIATAPGPDGTVFTLMAAPAAADPGFQCMVTLYETPASAAAPGPAEFQDASGNWCQDGPTARPFGTLGFDVAYADWYAGLGITGDTWVWNAAQGAAVTAELRTADGKTYPVLAHNGMFFGWVPAPEPGDARPVLTGYDATGGQVGQDTL